MIGIAADVAAVVIGGLLGVLVGRRLSAQFVSNMNLVFGVCAAGMGIYSICLMENMPAVILALTLGSALGLACKLGKGIEKAAGRLQNSLLSLRVFEQRAGPDESEANSLTVTIIILLCASGTGIYGCLDAGMTGNSTILLSKAVLDLFTALIFACNIGAVVSVIAVPQLVVFLFLFALARLVMPLTTPSMISDFKACGGFLLVATGLRMARIKDFPLADMLPAMLLVMPLSRLWSLVFTSLLALA